MKLKALQNRFLKMTLCCFAILALLQSCGNDKKPKQASDTETSDPAKLKSQKDLSHIKVGYCTPSLNAPFYAVLQSEVKKDVESYGMSFVTADGQDDISKQIAAIEDLMAKGINVLIINPLEPESLVPITKSAAAKGIPVFIVDSQISSKADYISSTEANNRGNGVVIGEWIANKMAGKPIKMALICGAKGNPVGREKREGMINGLIETKLVKNGSSNVDIVAQGWGNWSNNGGLKAMEDILVAHPDINVVFAENDAMAMGALKAINENGKLKNILVAGVDGQKEAYELIKSGELSCTAINSPAELARLVVESAVRYLNADKTLPKVIYTPTILVDKSNVESYYNPKAKF